MFRRWTGTQWTDITRLDRWTGTQWVSAARADRWTGTQWVPLISSNYVLVDSNGQMGTSYWLYLASGVGGERQYSTYVSLTTPSNLNDGGVFESNVSLNLSFANQLEIDWSGNTQYRKEIYLRAGDQSIRKYDDNWSRRTDIIDLSSVSGSHRVRFELESHQFVYIYGLKIT